MWQAEPKFSASPAGEKPQRCSSGFRSGKFVMLRDGELAAFSLFESCLRAFGFDLAGDSGVHGMDNVAESLLNELTIEREIARTLLQPVYGSGWQPG